MRFDTPQAYTDRVGVPNCEHWFVVNSGGPPALYPGVCRSEVPLLCQSTGLVERRYPEHKVAEIGRQ